MKILVTGAAGFIGTNLCIELIHQGHSVTGLDNLLTGQQKNVDLLEALGRTAAGSFLFYRRDVITDFGDIRPDQIYHLACPASPPHYQRDPIYTTDICYEGTKNMLKLAFRTNARLVIASTSEVYGDPNVNPQPESYVGSVNPIGIRSCYDEGKRIAESITKDYIRQYSVDAAIARIFNTYGPYMAADDGRVVTNFTLQAINSDPITIYGSGDQTRSLCYVSDTVRGLQCLMESGESGPINIGSDSDELSVKEIAELIIGIAGSDSQLTYQPLPADDPKQRRPDITLAKELLGWSPEVSLRSGLATMVSYMRVEYE